MKPSDESGDFEFGDSEQKVSPAVRRAMGYTMLSGLLASELEPDVFLEFLREDSLDFFRELFDRYDRKLVEDVVKALKSVPANRDGALDVKSDFASCFLLPRDRCAAPYASAYMEGSGRPYGKVGERVLLVLEEFKAEVDDAFEEPPDHISVILAALIRMMAALEDGESKKALALQKEFIDDLLLSWIRPWSERCDKVDVACDFYPALVRLLVDVIETDRKSLER